MEETTPVAKVRAVEVTATSWHRLIELVSVMAFVLIQALGWLELLRISEGWVGPLLLVAGMGIGWLLSDASSGVLHFLADNYGHESWPFVGGAFIRPFREHHRDPLAILRHGFLERNGNNALISLVAFVWVPFTELTGSRLWPLLASTCLSWGMWTVVTNQVHAWAHAAEVPGWVRVAQRLGVFLSPEQHDLHHRPPYRSNYCITSGVLDRLLRPRQES